MWGLTAGECDVTVDLDNVTAALQYHRPGIEVRFIGPSCMQRSELPARWLPIAESAEADQRCRYALGMWPDDFVRLLPRFLARLSVDLHDVRACRFGDEHVLVYVAAGAWGDDPYHVWVGRDPRMFGRTPRLWSSVPRPLRRFLTEVHPGLTDPDGLSYGVMRPEDMSTPAELAGMPDGLAGFYESDRIASTRLLRIGTDSGPLDLCVSPDAPGELILVSEGVVDRQPLGSGLDRFLSEA